jgi:hypothetical protein
MCAATWATCRRTSCCSTARCARTSPSACPCRRRQAIVAAADTAGPADFVNRHPQGVRHAGGRTRRSLSGGQRQAVGIARAVLHQRTDPAAGRTDQRDGLLHRGADHPARLAEFAARQDGGAGHPPHLAAGAGQPGDRGRQRPIVADGPRDRIMEALQAGRIARAADEREAAQRRSAGVRYPGDAASAHRTPELPGAGPHRDQRPGGQGGDQLRAGGRRADQPANAPPERSASCGWPLPWCCC